MIMGTNENARITNPIGLDKYALRCAKCALDEALGEKASPKIQVDVWREDIQEQRGPFEACG